MIAGHIAPLAIFGESTLFAATGDKELKVPAPAAAENCYAAIIPRILQQPAPLHYAVTMGQKLLSEFS